MTMTDRIEIINHALSFIKQNNACITVAHKKGGSGQPCVTDDKNRIVPFSIQNNEGDYVIPDTGCDFIPSDVIYGGMLCKHWGHFIINASIHLWYAVKHWKESNLPIVFSTPEKPEHRILDFLKLTGIPENRFVFIMKPTRFKSVIIPEPSFVMEKGDLYIAEEFKIPFDAVKSTAKPSKYKKIYLSRRKFSTPNSPLPYGEDVFEKLFKANGYKIIYPERLSLQEQINLFSGAETVATTNGTLAHNVVLMNDRQRLIILNRAVDHHINALQNSLNAIKHIECHQSDAFYAPLPTHHGFGPFYFQVTQEMAAILSSLDTPPPSLSTKNGIFDRFFEDWGRVYGNKENSAYKCLISLVGENTEQAALVSRCADCFISPNRFEKLLYKLLYEASFGRLKNFFRFRWKGYKFNPTKQNIAYRDSLKDKIFS